MTTASIMDVKIRCSTKTKGAGIQIAYCVAIDGMPVQISLMITT